MDKNLEYHILSEKRVMIEVLKGFVTLNDYINLKKRQLKDKEFNPYFNLIIDIRELKVSSANISKGQTKKFLEFIKPIDDFSKTKQVAVITTTPDQVVYSTINNMLDDRDIFYEIFSTKNAAIAWLGLNSSEIDIIS